MYDNETGILFAYPLLMEPRKVLTIWDTLHFIEILNKSVFIYFPTELADTDAWIFPLWNVTLVI